MQARAVPGLRQMPTDRPNPKLEPGQIPWPIVRQPHGADVAVRVSSCDGDRPSSRRFARATACRNAAPLRRRGGVLDAGGRDRARLLAARSTSTPECTTLFTPLQCFVATPLARRSEARLPREALGISHVGSSLHCVWARPFRFAVEVRRCGASECAKYLIHVCPSGTEGKSATLAVSRATPPRRLSLSRRPKMK